jgi:hypothetical protein
MSALENRTVMKIVAKLAPTATWLMALPIPGRNASIVRTETANKGRIMALVNGLESYMGPDGKTTVQEMVEKSYALGTFPALWAVEGVGKDLAEWHMQRSPNPKRMLNDAPLDPKYRGAWLMLHAGIGMGFARQPILALPRDPSPAQVRDFTMRFVTLCRENSRPGYAGAALESLGLVSRFMRSQEFCRSIHDVLGKEDPDANTYFWRGMGRCFYFHPENFPPGVSRPYRAFDMIDAAAPDEEIKQALYAGFSWALTVVNMITPEVMEYVLTHVPELVGQPGFVNGITSSVTMRYDTTPGEPLITRFMNHQPADRETAALWKEKVRASCELAIEKVHPALVSHQRLEEVFHYQPYPELLARLGD